MGHASSYPVHASKTRTMLFWILLWAVVLLSGSIAQSDDEEAAQRWVEQYNQDAQVVYFEYVSADWTYNTNITDYNSQLAVSSPYISI